jgi:hypothetical protein
MAELGDDPLLTQMLLDVASDLDAEADAIQAEASAASNTSASWLEPGDRMGCAQAGAFDLTIFGANIPPAGPPPNREPSIRVVQDAPAHLEGALESL